MAFQRAAGAYFERAKAKFPPVCPEFIIVSVDLAWLIDGDSKTVYVYRAGSSEPDKRTGITQLSAEGPIAGFDLDLTRIWGGPLARRFSPRTTVRSR